MRILKNNDVKAEHIKQIRNNILADSKETKFYLGINSTNIIKSLPIKNRDFEIWVTFSNENEIIGFLTFSDGYNDSKFIKEFYILPTLRKQGYGKELLKALYNENPKLECRINQGNIIMYNLVKVVNMRGEKRRCSLSNDTKQMPIWWSNYKQAQDYETN